MPNGREPTTGNPFPPLYAIVDASCFQDDRALFAFARDLLAGGVTLLQYRNKNGSARQMLSHARELRRMTPDARLIMNDRADLCLAADFDGVHLGQDDLSPAAARRIFTQDQWRPLTRPERGRTAESKERPAQKPLWVGVSTHNPEQLAVAEHTDADYLAIGPVFPTSSKANPDPVVGLEGVRAARAVTRKPLVAIGGITRANVRSVLDAGADAVAVISDLLRDPRRAAEEFLLILK